MVEKKNTTPLSKGNKQGETVVLDLNKLEKCTGYYFRLTVIEGTDFGCIFTLDKNEVLIGRKAKEGEAKPDIELEDQAASSRHAVFTKHKTITDDKFYVTLSDLGSKNGTAVNDDVVTTDNVGLTDGDKIRIGNTIIKFEITDTPAVSYHERLFQQVTRDPLTGLWNYNYAKQELERLISLGSRRGEPFSVLLIEPDYFEVINDTYSAATGDLILRTLAQRMLNDLSEHEIAARWVDKKFLVLLPESELQGAINVAERLRRLIETIDFTPIGCPQRVTVSIGISVFPHSGKKSEEIISQAEEALYRAKQTGHNKVCATEVKAAKKTARRPIPKPLILILLLAVGFGLYRNFYKPTEVDNNALVFSGVVESHHIQVASKIGGRISEVLVKEGDVVKKGEVIARFDVSDILAKQAKIKARIAQVEAELLKLNNGNRLVEIAEAESAAARELAVLEEKRNGPIIQEKMQVRADIDGIKAELANAEITFTRLDKLYVEGAESKQARDDAEKQVKVTQARLESAKAKLEALEIGTREEEKRAAEARYQQAMNNVKLLREGSRREDIANAQARLEEAKSELGLLEVDLKEQEILAPSNCVVEVMNVRPGDVLPPNKAVALLLESEDTWSRIYVPETKLGRVKLGQKAAITINTFPDKHFTGYVEQISQEAEFFRRNVQIRDDRDYQVFAVKVHLDNKESIFKSGMAVEVQLDENAPKVNVTTTTVNKADTANTPDTEKKADTPNTEKK